MSAAQAPAEDPSKSKIPERDARLKAQFEDIQTKYAAECDRSAMLQAQVAALEAQVAALFQQLEQCHSELAETQAKHSKDVTLALHTSKQSFLHTVSYFANSVLASVQRAEAYIAFY